MTQQHTPLRSSLTAVAAVLALSSTAAFAQSADQATPDSAAPAIAAPPAPVVSAAPAPEPTTSDTSSTMTAAPVEPSTPVAAPAPAAAPMATQSTPVIHQPDATASVPVKRDVVRTEAPVRSASTHVTTTHSTVSTTHATTPPVAKSTPVSTPAPTPALTPAAPPAATTTATTRTTTDASNADALEIAGAIGLGVIVLGAGAFLLARRRRDDEDEDLILATEPTEATIVSPVRTPEYVAATEAVTAVPNKAILAREDIGDERMTLDNGLDLSRFGRHVRAAYRGPTPDNPSHSLRKRLAHARFFDLRERQAIENGEIVPEAKPIAAPVVAKTAAPAKDDGQIVVRPGAGQSSRMRRFFGTAFQR